MFLDATTNHDLTHQEMACMKTALALVVIKRRLYEQDAASKQQQDQQQDHNLPVTKKPRRRTSSHSNRRQHWAQHLQHMMGLALDEASSSNTTSGISARFESLVTHVACQINEWATASQSLSNVEGEEDNDLQQQQQPCHTWLQEQLECLLDTTSSNRGSSSPASSSVLCLVWQHILQVPSTCDALIPMVLPLLLNATVGVETVRNNSSPHGWSLLYALLPLAPLEWVHETLADLLQSSSNKQWTIADLAPTYYHSWQQNKHASWMRWARADLVHRLVSRLQDEEEQEQHHIQAQSY